jgi:N-acetylated-alpha-linked acidic dipeptidase
MNKPVSRSLDILSPVNNGAIEWSAKLREDIVEGDPGSILRDEVPTFHGLSVSGNVTGKVVFAGKINRCSRLCCSLSELFFFQ